MGHPNVREALKGFYPKSKKWLAKVNKMTDAQAVAVYIRLFNSSYRRTDETHGHQKHGHE
jgi:hypothetical protein